MSQTVIQQELANRSGWTYTGDAIEKEYSFSIYMDGVTFINKLAASAEQLNHHPDIKLTWGRVFVTLSTHDAAGVTALDFRFADQADSFYSASE
ncbi:MAG: 4a-hydroxytetrahydrobiopterin dehydratase [Desulfobacterales bacterium]